MEIQDFKRWHWVLISLVVGAVLGYARTMATPDQQTDDRGGISAIQFVSNIDRPRTGNGYQWVTNIKIYPPQVLPVASANGSHRVNFVTCDLMYIVGPGQGQYNAVHFVAEIPFKVGNVRPPNDQYTIRDYLDGLKEHNPDIQYRYAWWAEPKAEVVMWMGGAFVLIGGIWPTLVNLMIGAGFARPKTPEKEYDLNRFSKSPDPVAAVARPGMTVADAEQLRQMQENMEKGLASAGIAMTGNSAGATDQPLAPGQVRILTGTSVEPSAGAHQDEEDKEYKGEFYPVVKPGHHPHEDEKKH